MKGGTILLLVSAALKESVCVCVSVSDVMCTSAKSSSVLQLFLLSWELLYASGARDSGKKAFVRLSLCARVCVPVCVCVCVLNTSLYISV